MVRAVESGKQPYIRFDGNDYSIPHHLVQKPLTLIASETEVRIVNCLEGHVFARHARSYDRGAVIEDAEHIAELARHKRHAHELRGRDRLRQSCPSTDALLDALARRSEPLSGQVSRLLKLVDQYGAGETDRAITEAMARGACSAASVAHVLDQRARLKRVAPPIDVVLPDDPRVRDLRVTPHALGPYDALSHDPENPDDESTR